MSLSVVLIHCSSLLACSTRYYLQKKGHGANPRFCHAETPARLVQPVTAVSLIAMFDFTRVMIVKSGPRICSMVSSMWSGRIFVSICVFVAGEISR